MALIRSSDANFQRPRTAGRRSTRAPSWENDMRILITGGGGFIGSHLAQAHLADGHEVWAVDTGMNLKVRHLLANPKFHYVKASVTEPEALEAFVIRCDLIY